MVADLVRMELLWKRQQAMVSLISLRIETGLFQSENGFRQ